MATTDRTTAVAGPAVRCSGDGGSVLVEAAIVFPLLAVIMTGLLEFGIAFKNRSLINAAMRNGVRVAAQLGPDPAADQRTLISLWSGLIQAKGVTKIQRVVVYESATADGAVPSNCLSVVLNDTSGAGVTGVCNAYSLVQVSTAGLNSSQFSNSCSTGWDHWWCPSSRVNSLTAVGGPDYIGLYLNLKYTTMTKLWGSSLTMTDSVVARIEPALN